MGLCVCVCACVCVCVYVCMCAKFIQLSVCICRCVRSVHVPRHVVQSLLDKMCHLQGHRRNAECMLRLAHVGSLLSHAIGQKSGPEKRVVWRTFFSDGASAPQGWYMTGLNFAIIANCTSESRPLHPQRQARPRTSSAPIGGQADRGGAPPDRAIAFAAVTRTH